MMFSSNQVLEISGPVGDGKYLSNALEFALKTSGDFECFTRADKPTKCVYQIAADGTFCIGSVYKNTKEGWNEFPFDFDLELISKIVEKHLSKQEIRHSEWDGSYTKGFVMKIIETSFDNEKDGIKNPFCGIVKFEPFACFYAK